MMESKLNIYRYDIPWQASFRTRGSAVLSSGPREPDDGYVWLPEICLRNRQSGSCAASSFDTYPTVHKAMQLS